MRTIYKDYTIVWGNELVDFGTVKLPIIKNFRVEVNKNHMIAETEGFDFPFVIETMNGSETFSIVYKRTNHKFVGKTKIQINFTYYGIQEDDEEDAIEEYENV